MTTSKPTKSCPYCGEEILAVAVKCKHCGSRLTAPPSPASQLPPTIVQPPVEGNPLGNASLVIGILGATTMFGLALCTITSINWQIIQATSTPMLICALTMAFLSLIGGLLGVAAFFPRRQRRATAIMGVILCTLACCILWAALAAVSRVAAGG